MRQVSEQGKGFLYAWNYGYDSRGNIVSVKLGTEEKLHYAYDSLSQLTRVDDAFEGRTHTYTYDAGGNLTSHQVYAYTRGELSGAAQKTVSYGYGDSSWKDKLTSYNGQSFTYDAIGNPLTWRDGMALTWKHGRELDSLTKAGTTYNYSYDEDGYRVKKQSGTSETLYYRNGGTLLTQKTGNDRMDFLYDENEQLLGFRDNGTSYYYRRNLQGDITGILDGDGTPVVAYTYDAWGKPMSCTGSKAGSIGQKNPFRYRGYYYDAESGLYYLNSRYYDPEVGRFINADDESILEEEQDHLIQYNLFAYGLNNPIKMADQEGEAAANIIGGVVGGAAGAAVGVLLAKQLGLKGWKKWALIAAATAGGAALGAFLGPKIAKVAKKIVNTYKAKMYTTGSPNKIGKVGEKLARIHKNTKSYAINGRMRIPDGINKGRRLLQEVKNVKRLSLTSQLRDFMQLSQKWGYTMELYIRPDTYLSGPLKNAIQEYGVVIRYLW